MGGWRRLVLGLAVGLLSWLAVIEPATATPAGPTIIGPRPVESGVYLNVWGGERESTTTVMLSFGRNSGCEGWSARWSMEFPEGISFEPKVTSGEGTLCNTVRGNVRYRITAPESGRFVIRVRYHAWFDSLHWHRAEHSLVMLMTPDSVYNLSYLGRGEPDRWQRSIGGQMHRYTGGVWLPLDPGEDDEVEPGFDERVWRSPSAKRHAPAGRMSSAVVGDSTVVVRCLLFVGSKGQVKYALPNNMTLPEPIRNAAVETVMKWRFEPALSRGRPTSTLQEVDVPVHLDRRR